jgi:nucleoside diphosphate kinase
VKSLASDAYRRGGVPEVIGTFEDKGMDALFGLSRKYEGAVKKVRGLVDATNPWT